MDATVAVEPLGAVATPLVTANSSSSSHSSSNSSSSNSSGYGSATTTPTNPASAGSNSSSHSHYDAHSTTPVGTVEPIPVATVATVTPYYSETYADSHQRTSYYHSHAYPMVSQAQMMPHYTTYDSYLGAGSYQHIPSVERSGSSARHASSSAYASSEKLAAVNSKLPTSPALQHHNHLTSNIGGAVSGAYGKLAAHTGDSNSASAKPQAAATPFYAQPLHATNQTPVGYFDPYKYNVPAKMSSHGPANDYANYGGHLQNAASTTYQHQSYYAAGKTLQDATYTAAVKPLPAPPSSSRQHVNSPYAAGGGSTTSNSTYYDKYMYTPTATPAASTLSAGSMNPVSYPSHVPPPPPSSAAHPPQYPPEMSVDSYRKTPSWHWSMDYAAGNCRSLPPPPSSSIPTAAVPPTNAAYLQQASSARDMYYPHEKYAGKYDKYNSYYHHQQYMSAARNVWSAAPHSHLGPPISERLPHLPPGATVAATHPSLPHHYAGATAASGTTRQSCCTQPFQQQNCYYPRPPHLIAANSYPPHVQPTTHYGPTSGSSAGSSNSSGKYGVLDYAPHTSKTKSPTDLYAAASPYEAATAHLNYNYPVAAGSNQHYVGSTPAPSAHQSLNPAMAPTQMHGDLSTAFYNDLNVPATYDNYASPAMQPTQHQQYQQYQQHQHQHQQHHAAAARASQHPPPTYASNSAKASLLDYRKTAAATTRQAVDCYMAQSTQLTNLDEHTAGGNSYAPYEMSSVGSVLYASREDVDGADKTSPNTKNLSLRDFLSTWNEDEEDYAASVGGGGAAAEELNFIATESHTTAAALTLQASDVAHMEGGKPAAYLHDNVAGVAQSYKSTTALHPPLPQPTAQQQLQQPQRQQLQQQQQQQQQQQIMENHVQFKGSFNTRPKIHVGITVDGTVDVETNQYINLPDIIIDIEKSNNVTPTLVPAKEEPTMELKDIPFGGFDVEKELDELQSKKVKMPAVEVVKPIRTDIGETPKAEALQPAKTSYECNAAGHEKVSNADSPSFKAVLLPVVEDEIVNTGKSVSAPGSPEPIIVHTPPPMALHHDMVEDDVAFALSAVHAEPEASGAVQPLDNPTQLIKDIECDNNSHSNESTFEKEYETFINKFGSDADVKHLLKDANTDIATGDKVDADSKPPTDICELKSDELILGAETNEDIKRNSETEREFAQNIKAFSKFYKRKRKCSETRKDEKCKKPALDTHNMPLANDSTNQIKQNFPKGHTKKCRKRKASGLNGISAVTVDKHRMCAAYARSRRALAFYYRLLRTLRRFRYGKSKLDTSSLVQQHIATLKERRLPLIKRQSAKKYASGLSKIYYNPKTLKCLSVGIVNTDAFRDGLLEDIESPPINAIAIAKKELLDSSRTPPSSVHSADVATPADKSHVEPIKNIANNTESPFIGHIADEILHENAAQMESDVIGQRHVDDNSQPEALKPIDKHNESELECAPVAMDVESVPPDSNNADIAPHATAKSANDAQIASNTVEAEKLEEKDEIETRACEDKKPQQYVDILPIANANENMEVFDTACQPTEHEPEPERQQRSPAISQLRTQSQAEFTSGVNENSLCASNKCVVAIDVNENSNASSTDNSSLSSDSSSSSSSSSDNSTDTSSVSSASDDDSVSSASEKSDLNELEELEKELSQHRSVEHAESRVSEKIDDNTSDYELEDMVREDTSSENVNDIANLKKMLEGDSDEHDEQPTNVVELLSKRGDDAADEDETIRDLQNSNNADKKEATEDDYVWKEVDASRVQSALEVAEEEEQCALDLHEKEAVQQSSDNEQANSQPAQPKTNDVQAILNEAQENSERMRGTSIQMVEESNEVLEISVEVLKKGDEVLETSVEVLEKSDEVLGTSIEELETSVEVQETSIEVLEKETEVQETLVEALETSIEVLEIGAEVQRTPVEVLETSIEVLEKEAEVPETSVATLETLIEVLEKGAEEQGTPVEVLEKGEEVLETSAEVPETSVEVLEKADEVSGISVKVQETSIEVLEKADEVSGISVKVQETSIEVLEKSDKVQETSAEVLETSVEVLDKADEVSEISARVQETSIEVLKKSDEVLGTSVEWLETSVNVPERADEVQETSVEVLERSAKVPQIPAEMLDKANDIQRKFDKEQLMAYEEQTNSFEVSAPSVKVQTTSHQEQAKPHEVLQDTDEEWENLKATPKISESCVDGSGTTIASLKSLVTACIDLNVLSSRNHNLNQQLVDQIDQNIADELDQVEHKIPKLSDLCKIALSSSFETSAPTLISDADVDADADADADADGQQKPLERELSVEEALAEMYRQAGVTSDPEDYDMDDKEAQDVLLINLEEILVSDSDLYVLQCDMNENVLSVVAHADAVEAAAPAANATVNAARVSGLQLVEVLDAEELQMTATHENVLVRNDNEAAAPAVVALTKPTTVAALTDKNADKATTTEMPAASSQGAVSADSEENNDNSLTSQFDLPTIHHEEIVPDNYKTFEKEKFIKYLHAKYVQKNISKFYHANRILKKYRRRFCKRVME